MVYLSVMCITYIKRWLTLVFFQEQLMCGKITSFVLTVRLSKYDDKIFKSLPRLVFFMLN